MSELDTIFTEIIVTNVQQKWFLEHVSEQIDLTLRDLNICVQMEAPTYSHRRIHGEKIGLIINDYRLVQNDHNVITYQKDLEKIYQDFNLQAVDMSFDDLNMFCELLIVKYLDYSHSDIYLD
jgi:hypothetical protein